MTVKRLTPAQLSAFCDRWQLTRDEAAATLGITPRSLFRHLSGERPITLTMSLLVHEIDNRWRLESRKQKA